MIKLVCSPKLVEDDIKAIEKGYKERDEVVYGSLLLEVNRIPEGVVNDSA